MRIFFRSKIVFINVAFVLFIMVMTVFPQRAGIGKAVSFKLFIDRMDNMLMKEDIKTAEKYLLETEKECSEKNACKKILNIYRLYIEGALSGSIYDADDLDIRARKTEVLRDAERMTLNRYYTDAFDLIEELNRLYPGDKDILSTITHLCKRMLEDKTTELAEIEFDEHFEILLEENTIFRQKKEDDRKEPDHAAAKEEVLKKVRELISQQEYKEADLLLVELKKDNPRDKTVDSLLSYVGFQIENQKETAPAEMPKISSRPEYVQKKQRIKESIKSLLQSDTDSLTKDARKELSRELFYDAVALYKQKKYEEASEKFGMIVRLEKGEEELYTKTSVEMLERIQDRVHTLNLSKIMAEEDYIDEEMLSVVRDHIEPLPQTNGISEIYPQGSKSLIEVPPIRKKLTKRISFDFEDISIRHVADFISQETGINIILSQQVIEQKPKISAKFGELEAYEAIKYMLKGAALSFRLEDDLLWIAYSSEFDTESLETKVYKLKHGAGLITEFSTSESSQAGISSFASISQIETLEDTLKEVVDWPGSSKLTFDKRTNALIVTNTPHNLNLIEEVLYNIDVEPLQILVESRFIEVDVTDLEEVGVEWRLNSDLSFNNASGGLKDGIDSGSGFNFNDFTNASQGLNLTYKGVLTDPQFQVVIHALEKMDKTKTLSSPRVTTLNNQLATMKIVDEWIYPTRYELQKVQVDTDGDGSSTAAEETIFQNVPVDFVRRDVGIILKVVPSVGSDMKTISLSIVPEVSEGTADYFEYTGGVSLPRFSSRNLATTVAVNTGDTVVLGGLVKEARINSKTKVPVLGDLPVLGGLFRKESENIQRRSLLIFVTAKLLNSKGEELKLTSLSM